MRSQDVKPQKTITRRKISKKKTAKNVCKKISMENRKNINEAFRLHKARGHDGDSWILVPKDSCEVYKARRKRLLESKRLQQRGKSPSSSNSGRNKNRKVARKFNRNPNRKSDKNSKSKQGPPRARSESQESAPSTTTCTETSFISTTSGSSSDMEYY